MRALQVDLHNAHIHGSVMVEDGHHLDQFNLIPGTVRTGELIADNPATWMLHCHVCPKLLCLFLLLCLSTSECGESTNPSYMLRQLVEHACRRSTCTSTAA